MGATNVGRTYDLNKLSLDEVRSSWNEEVEASLYEDGNSYSGEIGMLGKGFQMVSRIAKNEEEAHDYILDNHDKWERALAMKTDDDKIVIGGWASC